MLDFIIGPYTLHIWANTNNRKKYIKTPHVLYSNVSDFLFHAHNVREGYTIANKYFINLKLGLKNNVE